MRISSLPPRRIVIGIILARLYLFGFLFLCFRETNLHQDRKVFLFQREKQTRQDREAEIQASFWERLGPLDGQFYLDIANNGYRTISSSIHGDLGNYAFFPFMPTGLAAFRMVTSRFYIPLMIAGTLIAGIVGTLALWKIAEKCGANPLLAVGALLFFPSAPYQFILYSEGYFLCFSGLSILSALNRKPWPTMCFGLLAGLCRPQGVLLAIPAFVELILPQLKKTQRIPLAAWFTILTPLVGFLVMGIVSNLVAGSPSSFLTVQTNWGRTYQAGSSLRALVTVFGYEGPAMDLLGLFVGIGFIPIMWKRLPRSLFLYGVAAVLMPLATGSILSFGRFMSVSVPHMLAIAVLLQTRGMATRVVVLATFLVLQSLLARGLMGWYFVG